MTDIQKTDMVKTLIGNEHCTATEIETYLLLAADEITKKAFPFKASAEMPLEYETLQCQLAARMLLKRGFEGQTASTDNGVHRTWAASEFDDLLSSVVQRVGF